MTFTRVLCALFLGLTLVLSGCNKSEAPWHGENITGVMPNLAFQLTDENGQTVTAQNFLGKVTLLYFGYTHCPDVCPTTLSTLAHALKAMDSKKADEVRVLFVSVDPKRDTPELLKSYTNAFAPQVIGLTGDPQQLDALSKRYRVSYGYGKPDQNGNYEVYHSSAIFVFDGTGKIRLLSKDSNGSANIAQDLTRLVDELH